MCGIAGMLLRGPLDRAPLGDDEIRRMLVALRHRGPDGEGLWRDPGGGLVLGHRRLAVVDLSSAGTQPMRSADGRWVVSMNGEIYGYKDLRRRLEGLGSTFVSSSDTEVLVEAIARWGVERGLAEVNGMYALAVWDTRDRELWLARDPAGEKPLYVWEGGDRVVFASELGALRASDAFAPEVDTDAVATYLQLGYVPAPMAIYKGVAKLTAGEWRRYRGTDRCSGRTVSEVSASAGSADLLEVLTDAVALRTVADVPVGVFLSGGIDSTIIAALAARSGLARTFTATFEAASHDESVHAGAVARALGTDHTELPVSASDGLAVGQRLPSMFGEPFGDPSAIPTHLIAAEARRSVVVALTGDGGDELFGGYNRLVSGRRLDRLRRRLPRRARAGVAAMATRTDPATIDRVTEFVTRRLGRQRIPNLGDKVHKAASVLGAGATPAAIAALVSMWPDPDLLVGLGQPRSLGLGPRAFDEELLELDRSLTLPEQMLTKVDRATMAVALEARPPLLDPRVMAIARALPVEAHIRHGVGKQVLRALVPRLIDPSLLDRPKMGFDPPIGAWLRGPLRAWAEDLLAPDALRESGIERTEEVRRRWASHQAGSSSEELRLWTLLQYQLWFRSEHRSAPASAPTPARLRPAQPDLEVRRAEPADDEAVLELLAGAMHYDPGDDRFRRLFRWKHRDNPFGASPAWVAVSDGQVVGYRAFLRWEFEGQGRSWAAVRAVDTATHPTHQGRGIFRTLTLHAIDELRREGIDFIFNTPNDQSRPGYLKMGWQMVGRLQPWVHLRSPVAVPRMVQGRVPAGHWAEPTTAGEPAAAVFGDAVVTDGLLAATSSRDRDDPLRTRRSAAYLRWRYDSDLLGYRVVALGRDLAEGVAAFRLRRRGPALEATIGDLLVPDDRPGTARALVRRVVVESGADYGIQLRRSRPSGTMPLPGQGPTLVWRGIVSDQLIERDGWDVSMGDIELF